MDINDLKEEIKGVRERVHSMSASVGYIPQIANRLDEIDKKLEVHIIKGVEMRGDVDAVDVKINTHISDHCKMRAGVPTWIGVLLTAGALVTAIIALMK